MILPQTKKDLKHILEYLNEDNEIDALNKICKKTLIENEIILVVFIVVIAVLSKFDNMYEYILNNITYITINSLAIISFIQIFIRRKKEDSYEGSEKINESYKLFNLYRKIFKISMLWILVQSICLNIYDGNGMFFDGKLGFVAGVVLYFVYISVGLISNNIRRKLFGVTVENMANGIKKGQVDIALKSLSLEIKGKIFWGEGYSLAYKQLRILVSKLEEAKQIEEENVKSRIDFITNSSHDIRTPLTSIINYVDILKNKDISEEERKEALIVLENRIKRLRVLVDNLKEIDSKKIKLEEVNLDEILMLAINENKKPLDDKGLRVNVNIEKVECKLDKNSINRVFQNLISNIEKYSLEESEVSINLEKLSDEKAKISFINVLKENINIKPNELMKRFVRGEKSRTTEGNGLGLNIVKELVEIQGGNFKIDINKEMFIAEVILKVK